MSCPSGYVASDMYDTVFKCLAPPCLSDGTLPSCVLLVGTGQEVDGLEDVAHTCDDVGLGDHGGAEGAHGVAETYPCAWIDSTFLKMNHHPLMGSSVSPPAHQQVQVTIATVSLRRKDALPLAPRATRPS